jgi:ParB-like chromosome segregation protein Spo0J
MARRIEIWPTDRLVPYARNARTHSAEQIAQIAASILEFGFTNPILVDSMDGIIAGHGRLLAARKLGLAEVPVVVLDHLSETQRRAYILADNKLAMNAGWDEKMLASELRELETDGTDLALIGFSDEELEALLEDGDTPPEDVTDEVPETARPAGNPARRRVVDRSPPPDLRRLPRRGNDSRSVRRCAGQRGRDLAALRDAARVRR